MLICALGGFVLIALCCPDTVIGRAVRRWLVEAPAVALMDLTPRRALFLIAVCLFALAFAQVAPAEFLWIAASDAATWLELIAVAWLLSASRLAAGVLQQAAARSGRVLRPVLRAVGRARRFARSSRLARRRVPPPDKDRTAPWAAYA
jgi:hypothetical protein